MTLQPLLDASAWVQLHVLAALGAVMLAAVLLTRPKGDRLHRRLGRLWVGAMAVTAAGSFLIRSGGPFWGFSWIHGLSAFTLVMLVRAIGAARRGDIDAHRRTMVALTVFALGVTGAFTLAPGRIMHQVVFAGP